MADDPAIVRNAILATCCSWCGAKRGESCRSRKTGWPMEYLHKARKYAWSRHLIAEELKKNARLTAQ